MKEEDLKITSDPNVTTKAQQKAAELLPCIHIEGGFAPCLPGVSNMCESCLRRPAVAAALTEHTAEIEALKHDIERHLEIASNQAEEITQKDSQIANLREQLVDHSKAIATVTVKLAEKDQAKEQLFKLNEDLIHRCAEKEARLSKAEQAIKTFTLTHGKDCACSGCKWLRHAHVPTLQSALAEIERLRLSRHPTQEEADAIADGNAEAFVDGWTARRCLRCARWVFGGPTRCRSCVQLAAAEAMLEHERAMRAKAEFWQGDHEIVGRACLSCPDGDDEKHFWTDEQWLRHAGGENDQS